MLSSIDYCAAWCVLSPFVIVGLCGWAYERGQRDAIKKHQAATEERKQFLEDAGYDPTPRHIKKQTDSDMEDSN